MICIEASLFPHGVGHKTEPHRWQSRSDPPATLCICDNGNSVDAKKHRRQLSLHQQRLHPASDVRCTKTRQQIHRTDENHLADLIWLYPLQSSIQKTSVYLKVNHISDISEVQYMLDKKPHTVWIDACIM